MLECAVSLDHIVSAVVIGQYQSPIGNDFARTSSVE